MYKILDNLATHGIEYNYDDNQYLISKDSVSEEEILTFSEATDEDANKWLIIDARILSDYKVNDMQDYLALIDTCSLALNQNQQRRGHIKK